MAQPAAAMAQPAAAMADDFDEAELALDGTQRRTSVNINTIETVEELLDSRDILRDLAEQMKESGALRIKSHTKGLVSYELSFKGEYAVSWILDNVPAVKAPVEAASVAQEMMNIGIFHHVNHAPDFHPSSELYRFSSESRGVRRLVGQPMHRNLNDLRQRLVHTEDKLLRLVDAARAARADTDNKVLQLDWRVSVAEARLAAAETAIRRSLGVQLVLLGTFVCVFVARFGPLPGVIVDAAVPLGFVVLVVMFLEYRLLLRDFLNLKIDYSAMAGAIMGINQADMASQASGGFDRAESVLASDAEAGCDVPGITFAMPSMEHITGALFSVGRMSSAAVGVLTRASTWGALLSSRHGRDASDGSPPSSVCPMQTSLSSPGSLPTTLSSSDHEVTFGRSHSIGALVSHTASAQILSSLREPLQSEAAVPVAPGGVCAEPGPPADADFLGASGEKDFLVRQPAGAIGLLEPQKEVQGLVPVNGGVAQAFDGPLFAGRIVLWFNGMGLPDQAPYATMFKGKKRQTWVVVQGRFKQPVSAEKVYTGQSFRRPAKHMPPKWFVNHVMAHIVRTFARMVSSSTVVDFSDGMHVLFPLVMGAQAICVSRPGSEPDVLGLEPIEDMRLAEPSLVGKDGVGPASVEQRQRHFAKDAARAQHVFDPAHVYTFHIWQHVVDVAHYRLTGSLLGINIASHLDGQPLRFMAIDLASSHHLWNLEAWNRAILPAARKHTAAAESAGKHMQSYDSAALDESEFARRPKLGRASTGSVEAAANGAGKHPAAPAAMRTNGSHSIAAAEATAGPAPANPIAPQATKSAAYGRSISLRTSASHHAHTPSTPRLASASPALTSPAESAFLQSDYLIRNWDVQPTPELEAGDGDRYQEYSRTNPWAPVFFPSSKTMRLSGTERATLAAQSSQVGEPQTPDSEMMSSIAEGWGRDSQPVGAQVVTPRGRRVMVPITAGVPRREFGGRAFGQSFAGDDRRMSDDCSMGTSVATGGYEAASYVLSPRAALVHGGHAVDPSGSNFADDRLRGDPEASVHSACSVATQPNTAKPAKVKKKKGWTARVSKMLQPVSKKPNRAVV